MATLSKGQLFDPKLVSDLIQLTRGKSTVAKLSNAKPIPFNGQKEFTFNLDTDVDIVAENGAKSHGGATVEPVKIVPIKFEYGMRVSDEFMYATEEEKIDILKAFNEGFASKLAKGLDIASMHGLNPRTRTASAVVGTNNFDSKVTQTVTYAQADTAIDDAIALVEGAEREVNGIAIAPSVRGALSSMKSTSGERLYPEFAFGGVPSTLGAQTLDVNPTVSVSKTADATEDYVIVGDFQNMFRWGYAKDVMIDVIEYGDPDNTGKDLKGYNQVYIRGEAYIGWAILDAPSFAIAKHTK